jgi:hypothetical protein
MSAAKSKEDQKGKLPMLASELVFACIARGSDAMDDEVERREFIRAMNNAAFALVVSHSQTYNGGLMEMGKQFDILDTKCGIPERITASNAEKYQEILVKLDADKEKFRGLLKEGLRVFVIEKKWKEAEQLYIRYAHLVYYANGYQAPPTTDAAQAAKDAAGLSNHFALLAGSVFKELTTEKTK